MGKDTQSVFEAPLVFVDIETNGLSHIRGRIIEVAAIRVENGKITRVFNQLIDPETDIPAFITNLTGIRNMDLRGAMPFRQIADELHDILSGAVFVAHNVRFDYSFLKQEFKRVNKTFLPKQLCTVKLSRFLYPNQKSHKLENLIKIHGFGFEHRHRAYDDAHVLWQFLQHVYTQFPADIVNAAAARQIKQPSLPKGIHADIVKNLPELPGVYIFEDEFNMPLYIDKSINIKKRVLQHFGHDHDDSKEFKISQMIKNVSTHVTAGELEALLLESRLIKEMQPLYNRKLRKTDKLLVARQSTNAEGYTMISLQQSDLSDIEDTSTIASIYARRSRARDSLNDLQKLYSLCPKLLGLEKSSGACFLYQLKKCRGACAGHESSSLYNARTALAFERQRIQDWPYNGAVLVQEKFTEASTSSGIIVNQWCVLAQFTQDEFCEPQISPLQKAFDLDTYKILQSYLSTKISKLIVKPISREQLQQLGV